MLMCTAPTLSFDSAVGGSPAPAAVQRGASLSAEGDLVVRDLYEPGTGVDGYQAAPCWLLMPDGSRSENWCDAPAWDHAWWQTKRYLLAVTLYCLRDTNW